jgi:uncharacterized protein (DUF427 family)
VASVPRWAEAARARWRHTGRARPAFAAPPGPGQESVWDYPRPPRIEAEARELLVTAGGATLARSRRGARVLETASPPTFYLPPDDVALALLAPAPGRSWCEWKGEARYFALANAGRDGEPVAWSYPDPFPGFEAIAGWLAFYPGRVACHVGGVRAEPQPGGLYGGWVTPELAGPWKGAPGSEGW